MPSNRPTVLLYAQPDLLSVYLVDELLQKGCIVYIFSSDFRLWKRGKIFLTDNPSLKFVSAEHVNFVAADYVLVSVNFVGILANPLVNSDKVVNTYLRNAFEYLRHHQSKLLLYLPFLVNSKQKEIVNSALYAFQSIATKKIVFVGDLFGRGMDYLDHRPVSNYLYYAATSPILALSDNQYLFPLYVVDAANHIIRTLFSYWSGSEQVAIASVFNQNQLQEALPENYKLNKAVRKIVSIHYDVITKLEIRPTRNITQGAIASCLDWIYQDVQLGSIKQTNKTSVGIIISKPSINLRGLVDTQKVVSKLNTIDTPKLKAPKVNFPEANIKLPTLAKPDIKNKRALKWLMAIVFAYILVLPFLTLGFAGVALGLSYKTLTKAQKPSSILVNSSNRFSSFSKDGFQRLAFLPLVGQTFTNLGNTAAFLNRGSSMVNRASDAIGTSTTLLNSILGSEPYDIGDLSQKLYLQLDALYTEASFSQSEIKELGLLQRALPKAEDFNKMRQYLLAIRDVSARLPYLLGESERKVYMVLLQNNSELRPTGGFIGSFALISFENARLTDISVFDVYSADGQLKGHVEPPEAIKKYLGEANWYLRDSNWDPDFGASATHAEWFLDKEMERAVDGVVGLDLEVLRKLLTVLGEVNLPDFGEKVTAQNVYEKIQYEVETTFFPGSQKKATLLTSLTRQILAKLTSTQNVFNVDLLKIFWQSLEQRHIQIALHDQESQAVVQKFSWDGSVDPPNCTDPNCGVIWLGIAEANVGVNKANFFIKRKGDLVLSVNNKKVEYKLAVSLSNSSPTNTLTLGGKYKAYMRVLAAGGSTFDEVQITQGQATKKVNPEITSAKDRVEAGALVEVLPGQEAVVTYSWSHPFVVDFSQSGEIFLYWRKQAGTKDDPINITFDKLPLRTSLTGHLLQAIIQTLRPTFLVGSLGKKI